MALDLAENGAPSTEDIHPLVAYAAKRFEREYQRWNRWTSMWQEAYDHVVPQRDRFYQTSGGTEGDKRGMDLFDMTGVVSTGEFASRLHAGIMPPFVRWADFVPGTKIPQGQQAWVREKLDKIADTIFEILSHSNLASQIQECFLDLAIGHSTLLVERGLDSPIDFMAVPMTHNIWGVGPKGEPDANFRPESITPEALQIRFPRALKNRELMERVQSGAAQDFEIVHATWRDWSIKQDVVHQYVCYEKQTKALLTAYQYVGFGSCPYINFRWAKAAGELYGRGPALMAVPAIKTANLIVRDMLDAAEMSTVGMWQVDDDGVVNVRSIQIAPGVVIPVAPNSRGMQPLQPATNIRWSEFLLEELRADIKRALYDEMLGAPEGTPMSATEVRERQADMARRIGSPFMRIQVELVQPLLRRIVHILKEMREIEMPQINGREVQLIATSPLARAQEVESARNVFAWLEMNSTFYGPEVAAVISRPEVVAEYSATKMGVPQKLVRPPEESAQIQQQMRDAAMQGAA